MRKKHELAAELIIALLLFILVNAVSQALQRPISHNNGQGWDGKEYFSVAEQFSRHQKPVAKAPYVFRIGTPLLVSVFFKNDLFLGFKLINISGNLFAVILFVIWLRLYLNRRKTRILLTTFFVLMWHGPIRFVYYYPCFTDPWLFTFLLAGLIGINRIQARPVVARKLFLAVTAILGVVFREIALIIPVSFLVATNPVRQYRDFFSWALCKGVFRSAFRPPVMILIGCVFTFLLIKFAVSQNNSYSFIKTAVNWAYDKPLLTYLHAWFIAFGPVIVAAIYHWRGSLNFLIQNQFMLVYVLCFAVLGWIGGTDTERILFWGMPVVYLLIGKAMEDNRVLVQSLPVIVVMVVAQCISMRIFWMIPDYPTYSDTLFPILTIPGSSGQYLDLYSYHGNRIIQAISFSEYVMLSLALFAWLRFRAKKIESGKTGGQ